MNSPSKGERDVMNILTAGKTSVDIRKITQQYISYIYILKIKKKSRKKFVLISLWKRCTGKLKQRLQPTAEGLLLDNHVIKGTNTKVWICEPNSGLLQRSKQRYQAFTSVAN